MVRLIKNGVTVFRNEKDAEKLTADGWKKVGAEAQKTTQTAPAKTDADEEKNKSDGKAGSGKKSAAETKDGSDKKNADGKNKQ